MPAIDSLLRLMTVRGAEVLVVAAGEVPVLRRGGEPSNLSMPPLDAVLVSTFIAELTTDEQRAEIERAAKVEVPYALEDGAAFSVLIERRANGPRLTLRTGAAAKPAPRPAATVVPMTASSAAPSAVAPIFAPGPAAELAAELIGRAFAEVTARDASDLVVSAGRSARVRVDGRWVELFDVVFDDAAVQALARPHLTAAQQHELESTGSTDFAIDRRAQGGARFRVNLFKQQGGLAAALRPIRTAMPTLEELGLPDALHRMTAFPSGLVLMTGPAGSGKSTTLVALVEQLNRTRAKHVITIEDPIEYEYQPRRALIHQREVGRDVDSFATGLRAALREAPDVILLGEMRDLETISAALTAAETGHLVLATLHCRDAASAIDRLIDVYPAHQQRQVRTQIASSLRAVVTQVLLSARAGGRVPGYETMLVSSAIANLIREDKTYQIPSSIWTSKAAGMEPLERSLARLVRQGLVELEVAREVCADPERLDDVLRSLR
ncbi:MAG TPA: PilT/PilU family type 4a pilus ATPase [Kofleriaceae bacterium]|nr:PilT/PilU family type 4a pilus ATPase [Kofleriaceae bacterium]